MIMDDECDMCSYSACEHMVKRVSGDQREFRSMSALHASPSFSGFVR